MNELGKILLASLNDRLIQGYIWGIVGMVLIYWVRVITFGKYKELSAEDVANSSPHLAWIKWGPVLQGLFCAVAVTTFVGLDSWINRGKPTSPTLIGLLFGSYAIVEVMWPRVQVYILPIIK
jgi:hypothetical protein